MISPLTYLSFSSELQKIASTKKKKRKLRKQSGELTLDRSHFQQELDNSTKTPDRGPHPALNYEHSWSYGPEGA